MTLIAVLLSFVLAGAISRPLTQVVHASECLASGDWGYRINANTSIKDINSMAEAFNAMALGLKDREESLRISNEKLAASNKSYIDLIGFVAHELKGILASAVMNAYAVRDGYLGMVNFKQRKAHGFRHEEPRLPRCDGQEVPEPRPDRAGRAGRQQDHAEPQEGCLRRFDHLAGPDGRTRRVCRSPTRSIPIWSCRPTRT